MKKFTIDVKNIHIASSPEDKIYKTIEQLLELNKLIPSRRNEEKKDLTEKQLDKSSYDNKKSRGEQEEVTERQFGDRKEDSIDVMELRLEKAKPEDNGHRPKKESKEKVRGHNPKNVADIWLRVYEQEDKRKK